MRKRPPLNKSESEIRDLLTPGTSVNRDQLLYDCGYAAAIRALAGDLPSELNSQANKVLPNRRNTNSRVLAWPHWLSLISSVTAIVLGILLWQKPGPANQTVSLSQSPAVAKVGAPADAVSTSTDVDALALPQTNRPTPTPRTPFRNWLGLNFLQSPANRAISIDNLPEHAQLSVAYCSSFIRPRPHPPEFEIIAPLPLRAPKTRRQLFNELTESTF